MSFLYPRFHISAVSFQCHEERIFVEKPEEKDHQEDLDVAGRIISK
jgi:hypothetical protein